MSIFPKNIPLKILSRSSVILICSGICFFAACKKEPEVITRTETVYVPQVDTHTVYVPQVDTHIVYVTQVDTVLIQDSATTVILTRHAETTGIGADPELSTAGYERADALVKALSKLKVSAVYSTPYKRTQQTAAGVAQQHSLPIQPYDAQKLNQTADSILGKHAYQVVYVAGHSNTTTTFLNVLTGKNTYATIPESEYDNMYIVSVYRTGEAKVLHLKYGE